MNRINLILRDKSSTLLLIMGLGLSFFVAVNVLALLNSIEDAQKNRNKHAYKHEYYFDFYPSDFDDEDVDTRSYIQNMESMLSEMKTEKGNLSLYGYCFLVGDGMENPCEYMILSKNEKLPYKFVWGRAPKADEVLAHEPVVTVGNNMKDFIRETEGEKYITMDSVKYKVVGIYENTHNLEADYRMDVCTHYDCLDEEAIEVLKNDKADFLLRFSYGSSIMTPEEMETQIEEWEVLAEKYGYEVESVSERQKDGANQKLIKAKARINTFFMYLTFVFTLFNCIVISDIWIKRRYNEFVIRRTFGYSMTDIAILLVKNVICYALCALAVSIMMQSIYAVLLGKSHLNPAYIVQNTAFLSIVLLLTMAVTLAFPLVRISRILPAAEIRKQKR